jgi:hypothetical protein
MWSLDLNNGINNGKQRESMTARILHGDWIEQLKTLPDESVFDLFGKLVELLDLFASF